MKSIISLIINKYKQLLIEEKSPEVIAIENTQYKLQSKKTQKRWLETGYFTRVTKHDDLVGIFRRRFHYSPSIERVYSGTAFVAITRLPLQPSYLEIDFRQRPCYFAEIVYLDNNGDLPYNSIVLPNTLQFVLDAINNEDAMRALMITKHILNFNNLKKMV